jgi:hypothetical protein
MKIRDNNKKGNKLVLARKKLSQAVNRAKAEIKTQGIQARKDKRAWLARVKNCKDKNKLPAIEDLTPIRQPDKNPTVLESMKITEDFYPVLQLAVQQLEKEKKDDDILINPALLDQDDNNLILQLGDSQEKEEVLDYIDSSLLYPQYIDLSDIESNTGSIDSIQRNTDFIAL